jgi:hypothetical protein
MGTASDADIARRLARDPKTVGDRRRELGIPHFIGKFREWTAQEMRLLGTKPDPELAVQLGRSLFSIRNQRLKSGVPMCSRPDYRPWTDEEEKLLGTMPDREVARFLGRHYSGVLSHRLAKKIPYLNPRYRPWTSSEIKLLGTQPDEAVAKRTGRTTQAI